MHGRKTEHHHYSPEQVREHLTEACAILREQQFDPLVHEALLVAVYNSLAAKQIMMEQVVPGVANLAIPRGV